MKKVVAFIPLLFLGIALFAQRTKKTAPLILKGQLTHCKANLFSIYFDDANYMVAPDTFVRYDNLFWYLHTIYTSLFYNDKLSEEQKICSRKLAANSRKCKKE